MYCNNCGTKLREGNRFCTNCGNTISEEEQNIIMQENSKLEKRQKQQDKEDRIYFIIGGICMFIVAVFLLLKQGVIKVGGF